MQTEDTLKISPLPKFQMTFPHFVFLLIENYLLEICIFTFTPPRTGKECKFLEGGLVS